MKTTTKDARGIPNTSARIESNKAIKVPIMAMMTASIPVRILANILRAHVSISQ